MTAALVLEPVFTDAVAAVDEAQFLANRTGWAHAVVQRGQWLVVVKDRCGRLAPVLERCWPVE